MRLYYTNPTGSGKVQTRPDLSLGGFRSLTVCPNGAYGNLFSDISLYSVAENRDEYIGLALANEVGSDLANVKFHFVYPTGCQKVLALAFVSFNANGEIEVIPNYYSAPYNAVFHEADGSGNAINIGTVLKDAVIGIWVKKSIDKTAIQAEYSDSNIIANGNPVKADEDIDLVISWD